MNILVYLLPPDESPFAQDGTPSTTLEQTIEIIRKLSDKAKHIIDEDDIVYFYIVAGRYIDYQLRHKTEIEQELRKDFGFVILELSSYDQLLDTIIHNRTLIKTLYS